MAVPDEVISGVTKCVCSNVVKIVCNCDVLKGQEAIILLENNRKQLFSSLSVLNRYDYVFSQNGLVAHEKGKLTGEQVSKHEDCLL